MLKKEISEIRPARNKIQKYRGVFTLNQMADELHKQKLREKIDKQF